MYDAVVDAYCYSGTKVLKNRLILREQTALDEFEAAMTAQRADEPLPTGLLDVAHYQQIHHHLFQDVYEWAGKFREVRISKDGSAFCYPEYITREMEALFAELKKENYFCDLTPDMFAMKTAHFLSTLNAVHPFREGNGRTQTSFLFLLADNAGHTLNFEELDPERFLAAMIASFEGSENQLAEVIKELM